ncbi:MAG: diguanylate cyclase domain-containing protein [Caulobacteraceae bacterium]
MSNKARVLIVARDDSRAGPLAEGLDRLGWRTITARGPYAAAAALSEASIEAAIIDLAGIGADAIPMARRLKSASSPRRLPVIAMEAPALGDTAPGAGEAGTANKDFDLTLPFPLHPEQAAARLEVLVRLAIVEEQFHLRAQTFAERGRHLEIPRDDGRALRILAFGGPGPRFLALSNALAAAGADVVGAFTAYTAFDYLHERAFEAVVLWAPEDPAEALSISAGMRRNTRLYHVPTLLCVAREEAAGAPAVFRKGVSDLISSLEGEDKIARRVVSLAQAFRRETAIRQALEKARGSGLMDPATGLFARDLFAAHLARVASAAHVCGRPLSVVVLKVAETPQVALARAGGWLDRAIPQIGSMIGRLVRIEDTAARLGAEVFAIALPASPLPAALAAAERIAAVIACTAFEAGERTAPFVTEFEIGAAEVGPGNSAAAALEAAALGAGQRLAS